MVRQKHVSGGKISYKSKYLQPAEFYECEAYLMNKEEVYDFLNKRGVRYEITEHGEVFNMQELCSADLLYPESVAKNLFVRDDKKRNYYLITVKGEKRVNLKEFQANHKTGKLSFASERDVADILRLSAGSVTPFGLLNDETAKVHFYLDKDFVAEPGIIGIHPNDNTATVWLKTGELIEIVKEHGNTVDIFELRDLNT
jgi:Ala-tRNA(Pro) deacylase